MTQYHKVVSLTAREFIHPHRLGDGLAADEHDMTVWALHAAMVDPTPPILAGNPGNWQGRWYGHHVVVIGDAAGPDHAGVPASDLLFSACCSREEFDETIIYKRQYPEMQDDAERMLALGRFHDVSHLAREWLQVRHDIRYTGDTGWCGYVVASPAARS